MPPTNTPNPASLPTLSAHHHTWTRDGFLISTDPSLIPIQSLNAAFASPMCYWAKPLPEDAMRSMLSTSLNFGLYSPTSTLPPTNDDSLSDPSNPQDASQVLHEIAEHLPHSTQPQLQTTDASTNPKRPPLSTHPSSTPELIGFARLITDTVTLAYLTDVYILPQWQSQGLGKWLVQCVQEVIESMPYLRRSVALIGTKNDDGAKKGGTESFYRKLMKMEVMDGQNGGARVIQWKGPGNVY